MLSRLVKTVIISCGLFLGVCSCATGHKYDGIIYYAWGQQLVSLNLETGQRTVPYVNPKLILMWATKLDGQKFLFGSYTISGVLSADAVGSAHEFDRSDGKVTVFDVGQLSEISHPVYLPEHHALVYFGGCGNHTQALLWADIDKPAQQHLIECAVAPDGDSIVPVSDDEVVYSDDHDNRELLKLFNIKTGIVSTLNVLDCVPALWRSRTKQLLCSKGDSFNYFLTNLDGSGRQELPVGRYHVPLYYIPRLDVAIFNGTRAGFKGGIHEVGTLWFYDFKAKSMTEVADNVMVGAGGLIWYPD